MDKGFHDQVNCKAVKEGYLEEAFKIMEGYAHTNPVRLVPKSFYGKSINRSSHRGESFYEAQAHFWKNENKKLSTEVETIKLKSDTNHWKKIYEDQAKKFSHDLQIAEEIYNATISNLEKSQAKNQILKKDIAKIETSYLIPQCEINAELKAIRTQNHILMKMVDGYGDLIAGKIQEKKDDIKKAAGQASKVAHKLADVDDDVDAPRVPKKRTFKKFSFRGVDLDALLDMSTDELVKLFPARARRRFQRGLKRKPMALIKQLRKAINIIIFSFFFNYEELTDTLEFKREAPPGEKPEPVRTHLRNMIIVPEMIGSIIGVYNGKTFNQVEIKPEMISHYLAEFSISYKPVKHGRPGIGAIHSSRFIPLK
ncbi:40S ribosomal protein S15 [Hibiscus syriacus]|uniref:40S ribosomal protein S15 n=1 Tax=Hibiscus syriacus TaxID=106335 RepID=A0A6A3CKB8_HIBSY|nr:40S ribosomal protein S15 [Hibiscus syriacus]